VGPLSGCSFVLEVLVWEKHICGENTLLPEKERKEDVTDKDKILVPWRSTVYVTGLGRRIWLSLGYIAISLPTKSSQQRPC